MKILILLLIISTIGCQQPTSLQYPQLEDSRLPEYCSQSAAAILPVNSGSFDTGNNSEQIFCLIANGNPQSISSVKRVVYSVKLQNVQAGDLLQFTGYGAVTNPYNNSRVMVGFSAILALEPTATVGIEVTEARTYNLDFWRHHDTFEVFGQHAFTADYAEIYLNVVVYAQSMDLVERQNGLIVERDYGRLFGVLYKGGGL